MKKISVFGNPFIGLFSKSNEEFCLIGKSLDKKFIRYCDFATPIQLSLANSDLTGIYSSFNTNGIILGKLVEENEIKELKEKLKEIGIEMNFYKLKSNFSPGNNICVNDFGCIINPKMKNEIKEIQNVLGVEVVPMKINGFSTVGSTIFSTNKFLIAHPKTNEEEFKKIKEILKVNGYCGTLNSGFPFPTYSIVGNSRDCIVGELTTGYEMFKLNEYLG